MAVFIGAVKKEFTNKKELMAEMERLHRLFWIAESKVKYDPYIDGRVLNPAQLGAQKRIGSRIAKLFKTHKAKGLITEEENFNLTNKTYRDFLKSK